MAKAATELPTRAPTTWLWIDRIVFVATLLQCLPWNRRVAVQDWARERPASSAPLMPLYSWHQRQGVGKSQELAADVLIFDLEDSVAPEAKDEGARAGCCGACGRRLRAARSDRPHQCALDALGRAMICARRPRPARRRARSQGRDRRAYRAPMKPMTEAGLAEAPRSG